MAFWPPSSSGVDAASSCGRRRHGSGLACVGASGSCEPGYRREAGRGSAGSWRASAARRPLGRAVEAYDGATYRLGQIRGQLAVNRVEMRVARNNLRIADHRLASLLRDLYISGGGDSTLEVILGAKSLDDVITRLDAASRLSSQAEQIVQEVRTSGAMWHVAVPLSGGRAPLSRSSWLSVRRQNGRSRTGSPNVNDCCRRSRAKSSR